MDEEEEVDILGTYDDISKISSGQLLSCDYTVHPNWVNENADGGSFWTGSVPKHENLEGNVKVLQSEEIVIKEPEPVPHLMECEWNKESNTEDDLIFEDDIPASIEEIVEEDTLNSVASNSSSANPCSTYDDQCYDGWDLAAFETHPPAKNAKYIGPTNPRSLLKVKIQSRNEENSLNTPEHRQMCSRSTAEKPRKKFKQTLTVSQNLIIANNLNKLPLIKHKKQETQEDDTKRSKFRQTLKVNASSLGNGKFKFTEKWRKNPALHKAKRKNNKHRTHFDHFGENITINHEGNDEKTDSIKSETIIKVKACDTDSDVEVDVESDPPNEGGQLEPVSKVSPTSTSVSECLPERRPLSNDTASKAELSTELSSQLKDMSVPAEEFHIDSSDISDLEKYVHSEFFENRITKTPGQYLRIRNHILSVWAATKPNYISKTSVRTGLKQAGDVNCISRIHRLLEQLGAINFGHQGIYFEFIRPLENFISTLAQPPRNRTISNSMPSPKPPTLERQQRVRVNSYIIDTAPTAHDANYTISHTDRMAKFDSVAGLTGSRKSTKPCTSHIATELDLVKCLKFSKDNIAPFKVSISLSALLCLHLHALSADHEVMGFLGGHRSKAVGRNKLSLTRYKPCRTSQQSGTMCEMCPISQVEQSSSLRSEGLELLGWFHSHPLFPPNPSRTDVETQREMQEQFSFNSRPLVGMILSCLNFSLKCIYIMPKDLHSEFYDNGLPYELDVDVIKDCTDFRNDVKEILSMLQQNCDFPLDVIHKFKSTSSSVLQQYGYCVDTFFEGVFP